MKEYIEMGYDAFISVLSVCRFRIFVCNLSHCGVVAGNKNLLR